MKDVDEKLPLCSGSQKAAGKSESCCRKFPKFLVKVIFFALVCEAICAVFIWAFQEKLLFSSWWPRDGLPSQYLRRVNNDPRALPCTDVWMTTPDDVAIHGWLMRQPDSSKRPTLLYLQGNAGHIGHRLKLFARMYQLLNVNIFALSYRGYGESEGSPGEDGLYTDAQTALDTLLKHEDIDSDRIFVLGESVGGAVAIDLAAKRGHDLRGVIVHNTFTSLRDLLESFCPLFKHIPMSWLFHFQRLVMNSLEKIARVEIPVLIVVGLQDELVPPSHAGMLYSAAISAPQRRLYVIPEAGHNDIEPRSESGYAHALRRFLEVEGPHTAVESSLIGDTTVKHHLSPNTMHFVKPARI